ncbi:MAG: hypothetical protein M1818_000626 [Claussenomyces sp. TS43310]|nr:MAG: hypothetical protein M1818_000626 [Claussenomyces sp. TS43310]
MVSTRSLAVAAATLLFSMAAATDAPTPTIQKRAVGTASAVASVPIPGETMTSGGANTTAGGVYLTVYDDQLDSATPPNYVVSTSSSSSSSTSTSSTSSSTPSPTPKVTSTPSNGDGPTSTTPSVITVSGQVVYITPSSTAAVTHKSSGPNKAGIAAGVVVGVIAIAAVAGGVFLFLRRKKRQALEEEHKRQVAQSSFLNGKAGSSASSLPDSRLDPAVLRERRLSDGSIMDNQDYSRRILQVRNA